MMSGRKKHDVNAREKLQEGWDRKEIVDPWP